MIGGLNNTALTPALRDPGSARDGLGLPRGSAADGTPYDRQAGRNPAPLPSSSSPDSGQVTQGRVDQAAIRRRVEARQAAAESRLETFQPNQVSLASSRALDAFTAVASYQDRSGVVVAGVDIRV